VSAPFHIDLLRWMHAAQTAERRDITAAIVDSRNTQAMITCELTQ